MSHTLPNPRSTLRRAYMLARQNSSLRQLRQPPASKTRIAAGSATDSQIAAETATAVRTRTPFRQNRQLPMPSPFTFVAFVSSVLNLVLIVRQNRQPDHPLLARREAPSAAGVRGQGSHRSAGSARSAACSQEKGGPACSQAEVGLPTEGGRRRMGWAEERTHFRQKRQYLSLPILRVSP